MKEKRPALVSYIIDLNYLNIFILILSLFPAITKRIGIITPTVTLSNVIMRVTSILILSIISYGLLKLRRWGFWLMIAYNLFYVLIAIISLFKLTERSTYSSGLILSVIGLSLTLSAKRYFTKDYFTSERIQHKENER